MLRAIVRLAPCLLIAAACAGDGGSGGVIEPPGRSVLVSGTQLALVPGETVVITALVRDGDGQPLPGEPVTFTSSAPAVATVSADGQVTGVSPGSVTVRATSGSASATLALQVDQGGMVGAAGGTISAFGGAVELQVPGGALAAPVAVRISRAANPLLDPTAVAGSIYLVAPSSLTFATPATLRVRFAPQEAPFGLPLGDLRLRRFASSAWTALAAGSADEGLQTAQAQLDRSELVSVGWVPPAQPCTSPESRQFDFWLGSFIATQGGVATGSSEITLAPGGCAILEHFVSGGVGRSISFYVPGTGRWYQTYIDDAGSRVPLEGMLVNGAMELRFPAWDSRVHGMTRWSAVGANVRQEVMMSSTNGGASYGPPQYDFLYVRR